MLVSLPELLTFAEENSSVTGFVTFVLGLYIGNRQAIGRDRRREFNDLSERPFMTLNKQLESIAHGNPGQSVGDLRLLESYMPVYKKGLFRMHMKKYGEAFNGVCSYDMDTGTASIDSMKLRTLERRVKNLLSYLRRR